MTRWCPNCRAGWPDGRTTCGACMAQLVDDLNATVTCPHCDRAWPARMQSCPECFAELRPDPDAAALGLTDLLVEKHRLPRPADIAAFAEGPECTLLRGEPGSSLVYVGPLDWMEAYVRPAWPADRSDIAAVPPLACCDIDGAVLFRLVEHDGGVQATEPDGTPLATYAPRRDEVEVGNETGDPVAHLRQALGGWELIQTGTGTHLADLIVTEIELGGTHTDDQWALRIRHDLPLKPYAAVALLLAGKVLLGLARPRSKSLTHETVT
ncbi:MAG: hypothetical protein ACRD2W_06660 [Acidimicrobiales bacterium]